VLLIIDIQNQSIPLRQWGGGGVSVFDGPRVRGGWKVGVGKKMKRGKGKPR